MSVTRGLGFVADAVRRRSQGAVNVCPRTRPKRPKGGPSPSCSPFATLARSCSWHLLLPKAWISSLFVSLCDHLAASFEGMGMQLATFGLCCRV